jgi:hypothetical protein
MSLGRTARRRRRSGSRGGSWLPALRAALRYPGGTAIGSSHSTVMPTSSSSPNPKSSSAWRLARTISPSSSLTRIPCGTSVTCPGCGRGPRPSSAQGGRRALRCGWPWRPGRRPGRRRLLRMPPDATNRHPSGSGRPRWRCRTHPMRHSPRRGHRGDPTAPPRRGARSRSTASTRPVDHPAARPIETDGLRRQDPYVRCYRARSQGPVDSEAESEGDPVRSLPKLLSGARYSARHVRPECRIRRSTAIPMLSNGSSRDEAGPTPRERAEPVHRVPSLVTSSIHSK